MIRLAFLPFAALAAFIAAFGWAALGGSPLAFDDHPGQLHRVWLVVGGGVAPWRWHEGWWAGYPELQFYPPGFAYLGAALDALSLGALGVDRAYHALVWVAWAAPGVTSYLLLARALGGGVAALPGAFVALTLSAGIASGVEGGVHIGMVAARLGWAMLPLLLWLLAREAAPVAPAAPVTPATTAVLVIPLLALMTLTHPAHLPVAAVALVLVTTVGRRGRRRGVARVALVLAGAAALTAFWSLPLVMRLAETRALAWGSLADIVALLLQQPLAYVLVGLAAAAPWMAQTSAELLLARLPWPTLGVVALDALVAEPLGVRWLPADRVVDGAALAVVLAAGVTIGRGLDLAASRVAAPRAVLATIALGVVVALGIAGNTLMVWPHASAWPSLPATSRGLRLPDLWQRLAAAPEGRVLFTRSGVPLVYGPEWWRPHTHVTAITPRATGRGIVHGTFTHPSPLAALVYRGDTAPGAITTLAERLDGRSLFGRPLAELDAAALERYANVLGVSAIVAIDEDAPALRVLDDTSFRRRASSPPFVVWTRADPVALPRRVDDETWRIALTGPAGQWTTARIAYYPLWQAFDGTTPVPARRGALGDLELLLPRATVAIDLRYRAGWPEQLGVAVSAVALVAWGVAAALLCRRAQPASA